MFPGLIGKSRNETLIEMMAGILLYGIVGQLVLLFIPGSLVLLSIGWWTGIAEAIICSYHMWWVLDNTLGAGEEAAVKKIAFMSAFRYLFIVAVMVFVMVTQIGNPIAAVFGVFGLKCGAYLQPFMHFLRKKLLGYQDPVLEEDEL